MPLQRTQHPHCLQIAGPSPDGRIASWNAGAARITGYPAEEILGQPIAHLYVAEDVQQGVPDRELRLAVTQGRADNERWHVRKDGTWFWASGVSSALKETTGKLRGFAIVLRDLTERRQTEDILRISEERLRLIVESATEYATREAA